MDGARIAKIRESKGLSQAELANLLNIHTTTLSRWENGHMQPKISVIQELCKALNISESELLGEAKEEGKIEIVLVFGKMGEGVKINMDANRFQLFLGDGGEVGISGGGFFKSKEALKQFAADVLQELEFAFDAQVRRGLIHEGE